MKFHIDLVVTWVQIDDKHEAMKRDVLSNLKKKESHNTQVTGDTPPTRRYDSQFTRFRDNSEILFCLRSVRKHMPWVRCIFIVVADYQSPDQYFDMTAGKRSRGPEIRLIRHSEIFKDKSCLPTFNSQAIEANLHNIPSLSEQFLYSNDDFYCGRDLPPSFFFDMEYGFPRSLLEDSFIAQGPKAKGMNMHSMAWVNNAELLDNVLFQSPSVAAQSPKRRYPSHVMQPLLKSSFKEAQKNPLVKFCFERTSASPFRTPLDVYPIGFMIYWNLISGLSVARDSVGLTLFHDLEPGDDVAGLMKFIEQTKPPLFCVNDGGYTDKQGIVMRQMLRRIFPEAAEWELEFSPES